MVLYYKQFPEKGFPDHPERFFLIILNEFCDRYGTTAKRFRKRFIPFSPKSSPRWALFQRLWYTRREERGKDGVGDSYRASEDQLTCGQCWTGFSSTWFTHAPPWQTTQIHLSYINIYVYIYRLYINLYLYIYILYRLVYLYINIYMCIYIYHIYVQI